MPAGTQGEGQVVHAAKPKLGGKEGELILAARWVAHDDKRISLRGLQLGAAGGSNQTLAWATGVFASPLPFLITGRSALGAGRYFILPVEPGTLSYTVKSEASDNLTLEVGPDETAYVKCSIKMGIIVGRPDLAPGDKADFDKRSPKLKYVDADDVGPLVLADPAAPAAEAVAATTEATEATA